VGSRNYFFIKWYGRNENYKKIISLGKDVIPLILNDWKKTNYFWFEALHQLTGGTTYSI